MSMQSMQEWQARLLRAGIVTADSGSAIEEPAARPVWAVRLLAGIGGFIGALMILLLFGMGLASLKIFDSPPAALTLGAVLTGVAILVYRNGAGSAAAEQFGLAVSLAGQAALSLGLTDGFHGRTGMTWWPVVIIQALLLVPIDNGLHRTLLAAAIVVLGSLSCHDPGALVVWWTVLALVAAGWMAAESQLVARGHAQAVAPPVFGVLAGLMIMQGVWALDGERHFDAAARLPWHWAAALPALLVAVWFLGRGAALRDRSAAISLVLALALLGLWLPGWTTALLLAVLGLGGARPGWAVLATLAMIGSVSHFYYSLAATLLEKSAWMGAAGFVCLALARLVRAFGARASGKEVPQ